MTGDTDAAEGGHTAANSAHRFSSLLLVYISPGSPCAFVHLPWPV